MLYKVHPTQDPIGYVVKSKSTGRIAFTGTRRECLEWIEYNGHDEWN
jgi:hypothetical protein